MRVSKSLLDIEKAVIGTILCDDGSFGYMDACSVSLKKELFMDRKNAFIFGLLEELHKGGSVSTTQLDVWIYADEHNIKYGDVGNFVVYMNELSAFYSLRDMESFKRNVRELVKRYISQKRNGTR